MKNSTKIVYVVLAATVLVLTVAVLIPRAIHATGPQSVNPTSPRTPWSGSCSPTPLSSTSTEAACTITNTPTSAELVITSVTFTANSSGPSTPAGVSLSAITDGKLLRPWMVNLTGPPVTLNGGYFINYSTTTMFYIDPATIITCYETANTYAELDAMVDAHCEVFGYYVPST